MFLFSDIKPTNQNKQLEPIQNRFFTLLQYGNDVPHNGSQKFTSNLMRSHGFPWLDQWQSRKTGSPPFQWIFMKVNPGKRKKHFSDTQIILLAKKSPLIFPLYRNEITNFWGNKEESSANPFIFLLLTLKTITYIYIYIDCNICRPLKYHILWDSYLSFIYPYDLPVKRLVETTTSFLSHRWAQRCWLWSPSIVNEAQQSKSMCLCL